MKQKTFTITPFKASADNLSNHVEYLAGTLPHRAHGTKENERAMNYIIDGFIANEMIVHKQPYIANDKETFNVIGSIPGIEPTYKIIVGGHYDTAGRKPGADDNASAVAGLLELSRLISSGTPPPYTVEFVSFNTEEPPFFGSTRMGSYVHAKSLNRANIVGMINFEMIGLFSDEPGSQPQLPNYLGVQLPDVANFVVVQPDFKHQTFSKDVYEGMVEAQAMDIMMAPNLQGTGLDEMSDHMNYWGKNIPAVMITDGAFLRNNRYHTKYDTPDTLNYEYMAKVIDSVYYAIHSLK